MLHVATASAVTTTTPHSSRRPNLVSVGTIVWLSSELMFFAALFAVYFTIRSVSIGRGMPWPDAHLNIPFATFNTIVLVLSSVTCQMGVWAAEKGQVGKLRFWYIVSFLMGAFFIGGQLYEYSELAHEGTTLSSGAYGSVFYLTTGFHGLHVTGGLIAFLFMLGRTYAAKRFTHEQATSAIVVSYYWHFVDVVWIGLFATIYIIR
ncbi:cytochrome c oxidase subunit 3 [Bailinhaonella thermotolerans]|uniref:cytochrome-c oxidase n=1 Tax=Bailinhaonella thermotolerans TaxID=1070861 RepID=A0A3A4B011_9ACTN|nr:heme-copper oxidase subunit III [Bailinhaonella thermotolerans]RJL31423.1 heme-copper oxidase subunit III [Bailinhaonella thermotolerans]